MLYVAIMGYGVVGSGVAEVLLRLVPYFRQYCDSMALSDQLMQLPVLLAGAAIYALLTWWAWSISVKRFEQMDL